MTLDSSIKLYGTTKCSPLDNCTSIWVKLKSNHIQSLTVILFAKIQQQLCGLILIVLLMCLILSNVLKTNNIISTQRLDNRVQNTPALAIVTIISPDLVNGSIARISVANKRNYARRHGYEFILDTKIDGTRSALWSRVVTLHSVMHTRPNIEWFWYLDMDAFILEKQIDIYDHVIRKYQWGLKRENNITKDILMSNDCNAPESFNTGSFLIRNSQWSKNAMRTLYEKQYWEKNYQNEEQDVMFWLYNNHKDWRQKVQIFPMRLANSFPEPACGEVKRSQYQEGDMVVHYAGYRKSLPHIWPHAHHLLYAFAKLNNYFDQILASKHLLFYIQLRENDQNIEISNSVLHRTICLQSTLESQLHQCTTFLHEHSSNLHQLQSLIIDIDIPQLDLPHLRSLQYLSLVNDISPALFKTILAIPTLRVCQLKLRGTMQTITDYQSTENSNIETFYITISTEVDCILMNLFLSHMPKLKQLELYQSGLISHDDESVFSELGHNLPELRVVKYYKRTSYPPLSFFEQLIRVAPVLKRFQFMSDCVYLDEELFNDLQHYWWSILEQIKHVNIYMTGMQYMMNDINAEQRIKLHNNREILLSKNNQRCRLNWTEEDKDIIVFVHLSIQTL